MVIVVPLKLLKNLIKFRNFEKYTLIMGKTATVSETEKKLDIIFFAVIVSKRDFNIHKPG